MSHKARLRRLDARVRWLETEGTYIAIEAMMRTVEMMQEISDRIASDPAAAARWKATGFSLKLPPPSKSACPHPEERPEGSRLEGCEPAPPVLPTLRDAAPCAAPQGEVVRAEAPPAEPEPQPQPFSYDPPEHMQIRPVRWRPRGAYDYGSDYDGGGKCLVDYDPLADEYDDDS